MKATVSMLGVLLLLIFTSTAQPVITGASKLKAGDWYRTQEAFTATAVAGTTGINQTWNYSGLVNRTGFTAYDSVALPGGVPIPPVFSGANLMAYSTNIEPGSSYTNYNFLKTAGDTVRIMGSYSGNINETTSYQPPYTVFPYFPYTYDTYHIASTQEIDVYNGHADTTDYSIDYVATGYGTLILPGNRTFTNVLQVERIFYIVDPVFGTLNEVSNYTFYMAEGIPLPLLEMDIDTYNGAVNFVRYTTSYGRAAAVGPTYTFIGNGNWNNPANWQGGIMPPANITPGSSIVINHAPGGSCIINVPVTIPPGVQFIVSTGANLVLPGNLTIQ